MTRINSSGFSSEGATKRYTGLALLLSLFAFSPTVWAIAWHLRHGNSVWFAGKQMHVPLRWVGTTNYTEVNLGKLPRTILFGTWPVGGVTISRLLGQRAGDSDSEVVENWYRLHSALTTGTNLVLSST